MNPILNTNPKSPLYYLILFRKLYFPITFFGQLGHR